MLYHKCDCIWTHVLQTHIRLCPWERSQLEPLCIHTLLTTIYIYIYIYIYLSSQLGSYMNPCGSSSHMFMLLRVLTLRTSWYTCKYSQDLTSIHIPYRRYVCRWTHVVQSHICVPLRVSHLEPLDVHACIHKYTYILSQTRFVYEPVLCKVTYVCPCKCSNQDPLARTCRDHGLRQIFAASNNLRVFFLHMYVQAYIVLFVRVYVRLRVLNLRWDILVLVDFSKMFNLTLSILS